MDTAKIVKLDKLDETFAEKYITVAGRIFEKRKHKMFARFDRMSKGFTRAGKEIAIF